MSRRDHRPPAPLVRRREHHRSHEHDHAHNGNDRSDDIDDIDDSDDTTAVQCVLCCCWRASRLAATASTSASSSSKAGVAFAIIFAVLIAGMGTLVAYRRFILKKQGWDQARGRAAPRGAHRRR